MFTDRWDCRSEGGRILGLAVREAKGSIAAEGDDVLRRSRELWRIFIFFLVSPQANTGGRNAQLYDWTEVVQN